ncbi:hypothetical protein PM082_014966 [Marasmius tenuissimus]|nr:hypothetical protein PM082_014966 [Marasmius tenuissimus]
MNLARFEPSRCPSAKSRTDREASSDWIMLRAALGLNPVPSIQSRSPSRITRPSQSPLYIPPLRIRLPLPYLPLIELDGQSTTLYGAISMPSIMNDYAFLFSFNALSFAIPNVARVARIPIPPPT